MRCWRAASARIKEVRLDPDMTLEARRQAQEQFYREASVLARLDHPTLPKVSDYFSEADLDYLVMDYVPGPRPQRHHE